MALEIIWSIRAEKGFDKIVKHLEENWTEREIKPRKKQIVLVNIRSARQKPLK